MRWQRGGLRRRFAISAILGMVPLAAACASSSPTTHSKPPVAGDCRPGASCFTPISTANLPSNPATPGGPQAGAPSGPRQSLGPTPISRPRPSSGPPPASGYFSLQPAGASSSLPSDSQCAAEVHSSTWEPRPQNRQQNSTMPAPGAMAASFSSRPRDRAGTYNSLWDSWLLPRVDGRFTGTTDEILQWAACKWGLPDNLIRADAVVEFDLVSVSAPPRRRVIWGWGRRQLLLESRLQRRLPVTHRRLGHLLQRDCYRGRAGLGGARLPGRSADQ